MPRLLRMLLRPKGHRIKIERALRHEAGSRRKRCSRFVVEGSTVRIFLSLVEKKPKRTSNAGPDLSDRF